jgi:hypothetical protein
VRRVITRAEGRPFTLRWTTARRSRCRSRVDAAARSATIDFTGTSAQQTNNFNAPTAVCMAAVLYVFRTLVDDDIPLNAGCLKPLQVIIPPEGSMLNPRPPAAVVAGNVETSTCITNALYGALGVMAGSQCTMNNFTFGNARYQYYETISGGSGRGVFDAGFGAASGTSVVQTHMTNSRLTDPEVLEFRFPVRLDSYELRRGIGRRGPLARRRRRRAPRALPGADDGQHPVQRPPRASALRPGRARPDGAGARDRAAVATAWCAPTAAWRFAGEPHRRWRPRWSPGDVFEIIPDNAGAQPVDLPVVAGAAPARFTTLPVKAMVAALRDAGCPAELSNSAGTFVCNHVFYGLQHALRRRPSARSGFLHLPLLPSQAQRGEPSLPLATMVESVALALDVAWETPVDRAVTEGRLD